jgi:CRP/FNR family transcriptional regulator, cyclic AMP receptor protein
VFFIASGQTIVTIYSVAGKAISFRSLGPGDIFGEYAAIDGERRSASVEARSSCLIASMPANEFRKLLETEPVVALAVLKGLVRNVRSLTQRIYEFSTLAVNNRIQAELLRLASLAPKEGKGACLKPAPTHAEIASRVSTHREAVTRELNRLSRIGIIARQGGTHGPEDADCDDCHRANLGESLDSLLCTYVSGVPGARYQHLAAILCVLAAILRASRCELLPARS